MSGEGMEGQSVLAGEYVLGLLDAEATQAVERMAAADPVTLSPTWSPAGSACSRRDRRRRELPALERASPVEPRLTFAHEPSSAERAQRLIPASTA